MFGRRTVLQEIKGFLECQNVRWEMERGGESTSDLKTYADRRTQRQSEVETHPFSL